jgi:hypothetical protein
VAIQNYIHFLESLRSHRALAMKRGIDPSLRQSPSLALKERHAGGGLHGWRAEQEIEGWIALSGSARQVFRNAVPSSARPATYRS